MPEPQLPSLQVMPDSSYSLTATKTPPTIAETLGQAGQPLDASTRSFMEPRFGFDFSRVRIHSDAQAAKSAATAEARAFTIGNHIVFGASQYTPGSQASRSLLAHELTHVVQQSRPGGTPQGLIQRQTAAPGAGASQLRQDYIRVACETIAEIQRGVEEGRTWYFEDEMLLQGDEELSDPQTGLILERHTALQELVGHLDEIIRDLESGTLTPSQPASRDSLRALWRERHPGDSWPSDEVPRGTPARWSVPTGARHVPGEGVHRIFQSLGGYINNPPSSPPGMLGAASFPTWWVIGCQAAQETTPTSAPASRVTPEGLRLSPETVIFVARDGGAITGWHWEPRGESYPEGLRPFGPHEWSYDESAGRVYIIVDEQQYNLFPNGRVEIQH
ncbi:MAG: DUF4157 domain-containing protein [Anaerolineales bacterium]|nr:DUF4157 domain-containing protein [Anaerolineales bacterium]